MAHRSTSWQWTERLHPAGIHLNPGTNFDYPVPWRFVINGIQICESTFIVTCSVMHDRNVQVRESI